MYIAAVPVDFLARFSVDRWDPKNVMGTRGYQRNPEEKRVKAIAKYFERADSIMPVAGLLNVRDLPPVPGPINTRPTGDSPHA